MNLPPSLYLPKDWEFPVWAGSTNEQTFFCQWYKSERHHRALRLHAGSCEVAVSRGSLKDLSHPVLFISTSSDGHESARYEPGAEACILSSWPARLTNTQVDS
jgi:hypothetical protein